MPIKIAAILLFSLTAVSPCIASELSAWNGTYDFLEDDGTTVGGTPIKILYTLRIDGESCSLRREGFQTDNTVFCSTSGTSAKISVHFVSAIDEQGKERVTALAVGETLLQLRRGPGIDELLTEWRSVEPYEHPRKPYHAFVRSKD